MKYEKNELIFQHDVCLQTANSFGIKAQAHRLLVIDSVQQLIALYEAFQHDDELANLPRLILGGGSNLILSDFLPHLVLKVAIKARELIVETSDQFIVRAGAGENWHEFVQWTLAQGYGGLENLSLIPGTVGASPIQNIGAYGVEMQDRFHSLTAFDFVTGALKTFDKAECAFAYRDSNFKSSEPNRYLIVDVTFALPKQWQANLGYGDVAKYLTDIGITQPKPLDVSAAIIAIRQSKLPDPAKIGNAGSFFKNPIVSAELREQILQKFPQCVSYRQTNGSFKLAAGWLIDTCGWKGRSVGPVGVYEKQALVLVNLGGATGAEVRALAKDIQRTVFEQFAVELEVEPVFV
ncbi:UDP-N-acetylmuramate dehydrogenase [Undibacterium amnicola]|uniref:UDP-N-acetylenolpyruvoylglucosamine reductase n=1 Tax=Undibacterium amnicola TaxID=1834038 RepID=A0ABR6XLY1_9BURK|nr:UDP-N-acetylmuramate dehydrogenase [Undibacterium amnicola]MBC3830393.1 UDP-N-acetylmuramate dehydrogenase [Undibacterium amnicola]